MNKIVFKILLFSIFIWICHVYNLSADHCYCYLWPDDKRWLLGCFLQPNNSFSHYEQIPCERVKNFIGIGPLETQMKKNNGSLNINKKHKELAPWAFANLFVSNNKLDTLQLDLNSLSGQIDALQMAGLNNYLKTLLARTTIDVQWDSCSLVDLIHLEDITLNCKSKFKNFLSFGSAISMIRFVDCYQVPLQFYCIQCKQNYSIRVIRIKPGPELGTSLVKFSNLQHNYDAMNQTNDVLTFNQCIPDICSDEMLCRANEPLSQARLRNYQPIDPIQNVEDRKIEIGQTTSKLISIKMKNVTLFEPKNLINEQFIANRSNHSLKSSISISPWINYRIWIVSIILAVILLTLFTSCFLIALKQYHTNQRRLKYNRSNLRMATTNGHAHSKSFHKLLLNGSTEPNKIELIE